MQKRLYFVLMALVVISMLVAACGGGEEPTPAPVATEAPAVEQAEPTAPRPLKNPRLRRSR